VRQTSTDVEPRYPKSCSWNGRASSESDVLFNASYSRTFWWYELVATVIGYQTSTSSVYRTHTWWTCPTSHLQCLSL